MAENARSTGTIVMSHASVLTFLVFVFESIYRFGSKRILYVKQDTCDTVYHLLDDSLDISSIAEQ